MWREYRSPSQEFKQVTHTFRVDLLYPNRVKVTVREQPVSNRGSFLGTLPNKFFFWDYTTDYSPFRVSLLASFVWDFVGWPMLFGSLSFRFGFQFWLISLIIFLLAWWTTSLPLPTRSTWPHWRAPPTPVMSPSAGSSSATQSACKQPSPPKKTRSAEKVEIRQKIRLAEKKAPDEGLVQRKSF